jgi:RNA polymerase sigma-70 factor, ECF subfamily
MLSEYSARPQREAPPPAPAGAVAGRRVPTYRSPSVDLVRGAMRGDPSAVSRLLEEQRGRIVALARFFTGRVDDAEDLAQDILIRLMQALPSLESAETFDVWVYRLSRNRCVDFFRRRRLEAGWPDSEPAQVMWRSAAPPADTALAGNQSIDRLRTAIRALPPVWRSAVVLRDVQDLSYEEVARRLGVPVGTVKSRINRGRARLAAALTGGHSADSGLAAVGGRGGLIPPLREAGAR